MKHIGIYSFGLILLAFYLNGCKSNQEKSPQVSVEITADQLIQSGEYLVNISGCNDCHSPKELKPEGPMVINETRLSGYPAQRPVKMPDAGVLKQGWSVLNEDFTEAAGMWGISFAANLTPDQTGIGNWSEDNFKRALKEGKYKGLEGSRTLLPPMPWQNFSTIKDEDVKAMFSYLMSLKAVSNVVPLPVPPGEIK